MSQGTWLPRASKSEIPARRSAPPVQSRSSWPEGRWNLSVAPSPGRLSPFRRSEATPSCFRMLSTRSRSSLIVDAESEILERLPALDQRDVGGLAAAGEMDGGVVTRQDGEAEHVLVPGQSLAEVADLDRGVVYPVDPHDVILFYGRNCLGRPPRRRHAKAAARRAAGEPGTTKPFGPKRPSRRVRGSGMGQVRARRGAMSPVSPVVVLVSR